LGLFNGFVKVRNKAIILKALMVHDAKDIGYTHIFRTHCREELREFLQAGYTKSRRILELDLYHSNKNANPYLELVCRNF